MTVHLIFIYLLCTFILLVYLRWRYVKRYWAVRGIPYIEPHPLFGNLTFLYRENTGVWMRRMYQEFITKQQRPPYIGIWYFWKPVLMITSPELARNVLIKDFANFKNRHLRSDMNEPIGSLNVFIARDPLWSNIRKKLSPVFTSSKMKHIQCYVQCKVNALLLRIESEKDNRMNIREMFADFTTDVIESSAFGLASNTTLTGESSIRLITKDLLKPSFYRAIAWYTIFFLPELVNLFRFTFFPKQSLTYINNILKPIIDQRSQDTNYNGNKNLLHTLLELKRNGFKNGEEFTDDIVLAQTAAFLQAGFDTTAVALTFMIYEIAFNVPVQEKLYMELKDAKSKMNFDIIDLASLENFTYLDCVVKETLRIHSAMGWLDREAIDDYEVDENLTIKSGTPVVVNAIGMQSDPEYFPEPHKFNPDRFLPENQMNIKPYTYFPFGDGPRNCIGKRFALMTLKHTLTAIILKYSIEPYPDTKHPSEVLIARKGIFYGPEDLIHVKFVHRIMS